MATNASSEISGPRTYDHHRLLTIIRHPETVANVTHLLQGSTDSPLSVHGQNQQDALVKVIKKNTTTDFQGKEQPGQLVRSGVSPLTSGLSPSAVWSSPLPRAWNLAKAIHEAYFGHLIIQTRTEGEATSVPPLLPRVGLEEKSFGSKECCRGGLHVPGFPVGVKPFEDPAQWRKRVKQEGNAILQHLQSIKDTDQPDDDDHHHLVVVTHGLWISSFMDMFLRRGEHVTFADNTGIFTLALDSATSSTFRVVCANDTSHLIGVKRQRGGIGSSASDKKQRRLADMWVKK